MIEAYKTKIEKKMPFIILRSIFIKARTIGRDFINLMKYYIIPLFGII